MLGGMGHLVRGRDNAIGRLRKRRMRETPLRRLRTRRKSPRRSTTLSFSRLDRRDETGWVSQACEAAS